MPCCGEQGLASCTCTGPLKPPHLGIHGIRCSCIAGTLGQKRCADARKAVEGSVCGANSGCGTNGHMARCAHRHPSWPWRAEVCPPTSLAPTLPRDSSCKADEGFPEDEAPRCPWSPGSWCQLIAPLRCQRVIAAIRAQMVVPVGQVVDSCVGEGTCDRCSEQISQHA